MDDHIELITVLQQLHQISGLRLSVHDTQFHEIVAWPPAHCPFCAELQRNEQALRMCRESDQQAFARVKNSSGITFYRCRFGLHEAVAPIYSFGSLIGYLMMGQTLCRPEGTRREVLREALPYARDPDELREKLAAMELHDPEQMRACMQIMDICAKYISLSNRFNPEKADLAPAVYDYIHQNYAEPLTLDVLHRHFFCSRATLINAFRSRYRESIGHCITRVRVEQAQKQLAHSRRSIKEVAARCGFSNQNYFSKVFLKETGVTPTDYRRQAFAKEDEFHAAEKRTTAE